GDIRGREDWIRTSGLLLPKQALYQAELPPDRGARALEIRDFHADCNPAAGRTIAGQSGQTMVGHGKRRSKWRSRFGQRLPHRPWSPCRRADALLEEGAWHGSATRHRILNAATEGLQAEKPAEDEPAH